MSTPKRPRRVIHAALVALMLGGLVAAAVPVVRAQQSAQRQAPPPPTQGSFPKQGLTGETAEKHYENIQVLKNVPAEQIIPTMQYIAASLGVQCNYCHVQFANERDDKKTKLIARDMMKMVMDINGKYLPTTGRTINELNRVTCETCHHGLAKPRSLRAAMTEAVQSTGADSAIALYRALRLRYYGSAAYDFSELSLSEAGNQIAQVPDNRKAAISILKLNLEFFPQSIPTLQNLANVSIQAGDTAGAVDALNKALAIQPNNNQLRNLLQRIKPPGMH